MAAQPAAAPADAPQPGFLDSRRPYLWLCAAVLLIYGQTVGFGLTLLDDNVFSGDKLAFLSHWRNIGALFTQGSFLGGGGSETFYRPLLMLTSLVDGCLFGGNVGLWHLQNILFHAAASCLVYALFRRLGHGDRAFLLALAFAAHPALAQAVGWIGGRTDSFLAIPVLASFIGFLDYLRSGRARDLLLHLLFLAAALLTKELAVVLPAACCLYAALLVRPWPARRLAAAAAGWLTLLAGWKLLRQAILSGISGYSTASNIKSVCHNLPAALLYIGKAFIPVGCSTYPILADSTLLYGGVAAAALAWALLGSRRRDLRRAALGLGWFTLFLLPSFVYPKVSIVPVFFEYRLYLPLLGLLMIAAETDWVKAFDWSRGGCRRLWLASALVLGGLAAANARDYRGSYPYWLSAVVHSPHSAFAHKQLGIVYYFGRDFARAEEEYRRALALSPAEPLVHNNLGVIYMNTGRLAQAEAEYRQELCVNPGYNHALFNLGIVSYASGRRQEAAELWRRTIAVSPDYLDAYRNLALYHMANKEYPLAAAQCREVLRRGGQVPAGLLSALRPYLSDRP